MERVSEIARTEEHFTASTITLAQTGYAPSYHKLCIRNRCIQDAVQIDRIQTMGLMDTSRGPLAYFILDYQSLLAFLILVVARLLLSAYTEPRPF